MRGIGKSRKGLRVEELKLLNDIELLHRGNRGVWGWSIHFSMEMVELNAG
jgi:hypothetical protein